MTGRFLKLSKLDQIRLFGSMSNPKMAMLRPDSFGQRFTDAFHSFTPLSRCLIRALCTSLTRKGAGSTLPPQRSRRVSRVWNVRVELKRQWQANVASQGPQCGGAARSVAPVVGWFCRGKPKARRAMVGGIECNWEIFGVWRQLSCIHDPNRRIPKHVLDVVHFLRGLTISA